jgi:hypothetical protein
MNRVMVFFIGMPVERTLLSRRRAVAGTDVDEHGTPASFDAVRRTPSVRRPWLISTLRQGGHVVAWDKRLIVTPRAPAAMMRPYQ